MQKTSLGMSLANRHIRPKGVPSNDEFNQFARRLNQRFNEIVFQKVQIGMDGNRAIFKVNDFGIWNEYLRLMPAETRQYHNCSCCRQFIERYGLLVVIDNGTMKSAVWDETIAPNFYALIVARLRKKVEAQQIERQFFSSEIQWGQETTNSWNHFFITPNRDLVFKSKLVTDKQREAEQLEEFRILKDAVNTYNVKTTNFAVELLESANLYRADRIKPQAVWFNGFVKQMHQLARYKSKREIELWHQVASAPKGWCHIKNSVVGTIYDDIILGVSIDTIKKHVRDKMDPLQYQRPTAEPNEGNVRRADEIVEKLGLARSFERRFATLDDVEPVWAPKKPEPRNGFFSSKINKAQTKQSVEAEYMTWSRFARTVLPNADRIFLLTPTHGSFGAYTTAVHMDAPPILQWDLESSRNPIAWYVYYGGSDARQWGLQPNEYVEVLAICDQSEIMKGRGADQGEAILFALKDAADSKNKSLALFPETMKSELREIRSTIEAYSKNGVLERPAGQLASGLLSNFKATTITISVDIGSLKKRFVIDRFD